MTEHRTTKFRARVEATAVAGVNLVLMAVHLCLCVLVAVVPLRLASAGPVADPVLTCAVAVLLARACWLAFARHLAAFERARGEA